MEPLNLIPRPREEGKNRPHTYYVHVSKHFQDIYHKIVHKMLIKCDHAMPENVQYR